MAFTVGEQTLNALRQFVPVIYIVHCTCTLVHDIMFINSACLLFN